MKSINKAILLGNVGKDPEMRSTGGGTLVANLSIALAERFKDASGNWQDRTEWVQLVAFQRTAEIVRDYVKKGSRLHVMGRIKTDSWEDRNSGEKKYRTQVIIEDLVLLDKAEGGYEGKKQSTTSKRAPAPADETEISDDDIPF